MMFTLTSREPINIRFARAKIAAFDRVVEKPINAVAIVLVIFRRVDSALRRNAVRATRTVLETKAFHPVTEFAQSRRRRSTRESGPDHDNLKFSAVVRSYELGVVLMIRPFPRERSRWNFRIQVTDHSCCAGWTHPSKMAIGIEA